MYFILVDFYSCQWSLSSIIIPNNISFYNHLCILYNNKIFMFEAHHICKLNLRKNMHWAQQRIIWIAYYKNINNQNCYLSKMPKDIIAFMLNFLTISLFDDTRLNMNEAEDNFIGKPDRWQCHPEIKELTSDWVFAIHTLSLLVLLFCIIILGNVLFVSN